MLALAFAASLLLPPGPRSPAADAGVVSRVFPGVPPAWVAVRLAMLAAAAVLLSRGGIPVAREPLCAPAQGSHALPARRRRALAVAFAALHAATSPWASGLKPTGQSLHLAALAVPALLLATPASWITRWRGRATAALPAVGLVLAWTAWRLAVDPHSPRTADAVDVWRAFVSMASYVVRGGNPLTDGLGPDLPGVPATPLFLQGLPLFRAGVLPLDLGWIQALQILWLAGSAAGIAVLARALLGPGVGLVAAAVFLFAPYTRFVALSPWPYVVGPLLATAMLLCVLAACRRRSPAALAALGPLAGLALAYPPLAPATVLSIATLLWGLRGRWRGMEAGAVAAVASFVAALAPDPPYVFSLGTMAEEHFRLQGRLSLLEGVAMGQLPIAGTVETARAMVVRRPLDVLAGALLAPFAVARTSLRLWGDALFDPAGTVLLAIGCAAALRSALRSPVARFLLLLLLAAVAPAFVSNVDRTHLMRALVLPVPTALLAAAGAGVLVRALGSRGGRRSAVAATVLLVAAGGTLLFDVVNRRLVSASSLGLVFRALETRDLGRALVLDYPATNPDAHWLLTGPIAAFAGRQPVGYYGYGGGELPDMAADGKDLVFWSPGLERELGVRSAVCARWPAATLYEIRDDAGLGRVHAARLAGVPWTPHRPVATWSAAPCRASGSGGAA